MTRGSRTARHDGRGGMRIGTPGRLLAAGVMALLYSALLGGFAYGFYEYVSDTPRLKVRHVRIEGLDRVGAEEVLDAAGVTQEDTILFLQPDRIAAQVSAMPYVRSCTVTRQFPDRVVVGVMERRPVATLLVSNHLYEIDAELVILRRLESDEPPIGPLITGVPGLAVVAPGEALTQPELEEAMAVWRAFSATNVARSMKVSELAAVAENEIRMYCDGLPFRIVWGGGNYDDQAMRLDILWREMGGAPGCGAYLDMRFGRDLACK